MPLISAPPPKGPLARYRQLSPSANIKVSPLCLGAMTFGDKQQEVYGEMTKQAALEILDYYYEQGGNFIDTANVYQHGQSEEWIGEWMKTKGNRDEIVLATKYSGYFATGEGRIESNLGGNGSKSMRLGLEGSLKRLGTEYIDLYYVHW
jgi:aryl-alcohol dehydrogenase-like predicted oxidoreductase